MNKILILEPHGRAFVFPRETSINLFLGGATWKSSSFVVPYSVIWMWLCLVISIIIITSSIYNDLHLCRFRPSSMSEPYISNCSFFSGCNCQNFQFHDTWLDNNYTVFWGCEWRIWWILSTAAVCVCVNPVRQEGEEGGMIFFVQTIGDGLFRFKFMTSQYCMLSYFTWLSVAEDLK